MKILLLTNHLNAGGIARYLLTLNKGFTARGHQVTVVTDGGDMVAEVEATGALHRAMDLRTKSEMSWKLFKAIRPLKELIKENRIDIVHAQTRTTQVLGNCVSKLTGTAYVSTFHGFFKRRLARRMFPCIGRYAIAVSPAVKEHLIRDFHIPEEKVFMIPNGIDIAQFPPITQEMRLTNRKRFQLDRGPLIGIIARLSDVKGHEVLLQAMQKVVLYFPKAKLLIVGQGPMEEALRAKTLELGLQQQVLFFSTVNKTLEMLSLLDVFVMPSLQEGLGLSVMEAQAVGLPVVVSNVGGLPSIVKDRETGLLVPVRDADALAEKIIYLLKHPAEAEGMGQRARRQIENVYSEDRMIEETLAVYKRAIG